MHAAANLILYIASRRVTQTLQLAFASLSLVKEEDAPRAAKRGPQKRRFSLTFSRKNRESGNENVVGDADPRCDVESVLRDPHSRFSDSRVSYDRSGRVAPSRTLRSASEKKSKYFRFPSAKHGRGNPLF